MRLSVQLFTLRDAMADVESTLMTLRRAGLEYVELAGLYGRSGSQFRQLLDHVGLSVSGSHIMLEALEEDFDLVVEENLALDNRWIIVPWISEERRDWARLGQIMNGLGERLSQAGLKLAYHNHDFEISGGGLRELAAATDPALVSFQLDLGWIHFAGQDPAEFLRSFSGRVPLVHLKDLNPGSEILHVVSGQGTVDWNGALKACEDVGVEFGSIEMDHPPTNPVDDVLACIHYFRSKGVA